MINTKFGPNKKILTKDFLFLGLEQKSKRKKQLLKREPKALKKDHTGTRFDQFGFGVNLLKKVMHCDQRKQVKFLP